MVKGFSLLICCLASLSIPVLGISPIVAQIEGSAVPGFGPTAGLNDAATQLFQISDGYRIAKNICRPCHIIGPHSDPRTVLPNPGPSFEDVANRPNTTVESLKHFLATTTWDMSSRPVKMPNKRLSDKSMSAVSSYIMSLKQQTIATQLPGVDQF